MKKIVSIGLAVAMSLSLVACGGKTEKETKLTGQKVVYKNVMDIVATGEKVEFNKNGNSDNLMIEFTLTNTGDRDRSFSAAGIPKAYQGNKQLTTTMLYFRTKKGNYENGNMVIKKGQTKKISYGWRLADSKEDVKLEFKSNIAGAGEGEMTFKVDGKETKLHKKAAEESKAVFDKYKKIKTIESDGYKYKLDKGWVTVSAGSISAVIEKEDEDLNKKRIYFSCGFASSKEKAKEKADKQADTYKVKVEKIKVGGKDGYLVASSTNSHNVYVDSKSGVVQITSYLVDKKDIDKVLEKIEIK